MVRFILQLLPVAFISFSLNTSSNIFTVGVPFYRAWSALTLQHNTINYSVVTLWWQMLGQSMLLTFLDPSYG